MPAGRAHRVDLPAGGRIALARVVHRRDRTRQLRRHDAVVEQTAAAREPIAERAHAGELAVVEHAIGAGARRRREHGDRRLALAEHAAQIGGHVVGDEIVEPAPPLRRDAAIQRAQGAVPVRALGAVGDEVGLHVDHGRVAREAGVGRVLRRARPRRGRDTTRARPRRSARAVPPRCRAGSPSRRPVPCPCAHCWRDRARACRRARARRAA